MYTKTERKLFSDKELAEREQLIEAIVTACDEDDLRVFTTEYFSADISVFPCRISSGDIYDG